MSDRPVIRLARVEDREQLWPLAQQLATSNAVDPEAYARNYADVLSRSEVRLLVAESDGRVIGYLLAQRHHTFHANGPVVWVEELMVAPGRRRTGVGRALMHAVEQWADEQGGAYVALATRRAPDFYTALGYEPSATYFKRTR